MDKEDAKPSRVSQADIPSLTLQNSEKVAFAIWDNFAGKGAAPHNVALALGLSPTSGGWRMLCGASIAYGLTDGGYNAAMITLTELGRRMVAPTLEGDDAAARQEAVLRPKLPREFFKQYDRAKFPRDEIAANVLVGMGMPKERASDLVSLLRQNGTYVGFIRETKTGPFVALDGANQPTPAAADPEDASDGTVAPAERVNVVDSIPTGEVRQTTALATPQTNKVFITHGKNTKIMEQIKKLVTLGGFDPVVAVEQQTTAKPLPSKVMDAMRGCSASIIHVGSEGILTDVNGIPHPQINPNVLIEIGASMALYDNKFILVVEDGVDLPSNLQGLYQSRYQGDSIELDAGMKILEALRGLGKP
ncbi:TIR domain-containing protein [Devosia sp. 67-54]|uniref:TIR domain-containing protein n=2 Tax=unclassified Devosia TaxID=196773 RepID=UPI001AC3D091|nr:TIR domain-containing protein [Devosia sp. 67-54]MBN9303693.1 nucleotide-binding protein [Devosia sp.]